MLLNRLTHTANSVRHRYYDEESYRKYNEDEGYMKKVATPPMDVFVEQFRSELASTQKQESRRLESFQRLPKSRNSHRMLQETPTLPPSQISMRLDVVQD
jgi:hypothetical protein